MSAPTIQYLRSVIAMAVGLAIGGALNLFLVQGSVALLSPPDLSDWRAYPDLLEPQLYAALFLSHALSTFVGALGAYMIAARFRAYITYAIGAIFLFTGFVTGPGNGAPTGFIALNVVGAYFPMCWLAIRAADHLQTSWRRAPVVTAAPL